MPKKNKTARKARLDPARTAKPRTRSVAHVPAGRKIVGHHLVESYELRDADADEPIAVLVDDSPAMHVALHNIAAYAEEEAGNISRFAEYADYTIAGRPVSRGEAAKAFTALARAIRAAIPDE